MGRALGGLLVVGGALWAAASAAEPEKSKAVKIELRSAAEYRPEWELSFPVEIEDEEYARQLEHFKIEVAAVSPDNTLEYITGLTQDRPAKKVGRREDDPRFYIGWKSGTLEAADRRLLAKAGIKSYRKELLHFIPDDVREQMEQLEQDYADRERQQIKRTRFEIRATQPDGYEFVVVEQDGAPASSRARSSPRLLKRSDD